jgi:uronate dehydrogenase
MAKEFSRILLTGASGALAGVLRTPLAARASRLRLSDRRPVGQIAAHEEEVVGDLADAELVSRITRNVDVVVHMGGAVGADLPFTEILQSNVIGLTNLYEACRVNGVQRVIWASSCHAIGFYPRTLRIDAAVMPRPDTFYGVSKVYGEAVAQYYWDKFRLESVSIRIGSCFPKPTDTRMLSTWQSYPDFVRLVECCLGAPRVEHTIVYGVSNNDSQLWDNRLAAHLGYRPQDNAEAFRAEIETTADFKPDDILVAVHGGRFAAAGHGALGRDAAVGPAAMTRS